MNKKRKVLTLAPNEEIYVTSTSCKYSIKIKNANEELDVEEIEEYVNKILKYHEDLIYGNKHEDMETHQFQCITYY